MTQVYFSKVRVVARLLHKHSPAFSPGLSAEVLYIYILQWGTLWTEWSFSACLDMLPFGKQETYPRQQPNNRLHSPGANKEKEARKDRKSPNNTCCDTPWGSENPPWRPLTSQHYKLFCFYTFWNNVRTTFFTWLGWITFCWAKSKEYIYIFPTVTIIQSTAWETLDFWDWYWYQYLIFYNILANNHFLKINIFDKDPLNVVIKDLWWSYVTLVSTFWWKNCKKTISDYLDYAHMLLELKWTEHYLACTQIIFINHFGHFSSRNWIYSHM